MVCTCFYDENDNFNDKRFILTSYNHVVSKEDKKSSSSKLQSNSVEVRETTLKKSLGCNTPNNSVFQHGLSSVENNSHFSLIDSFYKEESGRSCSSLNEKEVIDSLSLSIQRKKDTSLLVYSSPSFSLPKDINYMNVVQ